MNAEPLGADGPPPVRRTFLPAALDIPSYGPLLPSPLRVAVDLAPADDTLGWGARIEGAEVSFHGNYIGLEERVALGGLAWEDLLHLVEALCACCSQANTLALAQAAESLGHLIVPPRGAYLRLVLVETERITSHLLNSAEVCSACGLNDAAMTLRDLRERVLYALAEWTGSRVRQGMITYGGLARNLDDASTELFAAALRPLERVLRDAVASLIGNRELARRLSGLGALSVEEAVVAGLRGPVSRASGVATDIRATFATGAYEDEGVTVVVQRGGDAFARFAVRLMESLESFRIIAQALDDLPAGPVRGRSDVELREGSGVGRVEGPRGEVFCWVRGGSSGPTGLHLSGGSFPLAGILAGLLPGHRIEDLPLFLLSLDLCVASVER